MDLEGQHGQRGYAMAALLVALAVMAVLMSAALPAWRHQAKRQTEIEYIWRAEQYARAVGLYRRKMANTFPPTVDVLVQQRFLRKKYKDPLSNDDFQLLYAGNQQQQQPGARVQGGAGIVGVTSKSKGTSIRVYKGRTNYAEWQVTFADVSAGRGAGPAQGSETPGMGPGRGQGTPGGRGGRGGRGAGPQDPFGPATPGNPGRPDRGFPGRGRGGQ